MVKPLGGLGVAAVIQTLICDVINRTRSDHNSVCIYLSRGAHKGLSMANGCSHVFCMLESRGVASSVGAGKSTNGRLCGHL